jgi:VWFA-related protein
MWTSVGPAFWVAKALSSATRGRTWRSEIQTELHRDIAPAVKPGGDSSAAVESGFPGVTRMCGGVFVGVGLAAAFLWAGGGYFAGWAQTAPAPSPGLNGAATAGVPQQLGASSAPTLRVTSRETVVDVTVTDAKGQPVHGLVQSDFTVKEDGQPQPLRSFQEVREDVPPTPAHPPQQLPANVYTNLQPAPTTSAVNILLLDGLNTLPADQVNMRQESLKYLKGLPRGTRIAVLGLTSSLRVLQGFTSDPAILIAAVDSKKNRALPSPFIDNDSAAILDDQADAQTELGNDDAAAAIQEFSNEQVAVQTDIRNRMTLEALDQIAAYVGGIKGRKNLIWFTDGMPLNLFPTSGVDDLQGMTDYAKELRKTTDLLTAAEVAVYPVDARKLFNPVANEADQHLDRITVRTGGVVATGQLKAQEKKGGQLLGMEAVAEATGGAAYYNTNDLKTAVAKAISNGANYYTVSYIPPDLRFDGRYHSIDVAVDRPGVHLAYRKGYNGDDILHNAISPAFSLATNAPEPFGSNMIASMGRGVPTSSQLLFSVGVTPNTQPVKPEDSGIAGTLDTKLKDKPLVRYEVQYSLPSRQIAFADNPDGTRRCSLEFDLAAYDVFGKRITGLSQTVSPRPITAEHYQQIVRTPLRFFQKLDLPVGEVFLRVGILDAVSATVGTLEIPLVVSRKLAKPVASAGGQVDP